MKIFLAIALCFSLISPALAQLSKQEAKQKYEAAEVYMMESRYYRALPLYQQLLANEPDNANYNYKIGLCFLRSPEKNKATAFLENAIRNASKDYMEMEFGENRAPINAYLQLARAYHLEYRFDEAILAAEKYITLSKYKSDKEAGTKLITECKTARELVKDPAKVRINNLGNQVNTRSREYAPVISVDGESLFFTSNREGNRGEINEEDGSPFSDIYKTCFENENWIPAFPIDSSINSPGHEAAIAISADGNEMLIYREDNNGDIYITQFMGDQWTIPVPIGKGINSDAHEPSACFSPDGRRLFFVSDRKGGHGGKDIYVAYKDTNGAWSSIRNMGPSINTPYDEDAPFMHPDGKNLFFCSNGHNTMGGYDIFYTIYKPETDVYSLPINMGYPVNTPDDEAFYVMSPDGTRSYFASAKTDGLGDLDIYEAEFETSKTGEVAIIKGVMINHANVDMSNSTVVLINARTGEVVNVSKANSKSGNYTLVALPGDEYYLSYMLDGKEIYREKINIQVKPGQHLVKIKKDIEIGKTADGTLAVKGTEADTTSMPLKNDVIDGPMTANTGGSKIEPASSFAPGFTKYFRYNKHQVNGKEKDYQTFLKELKGAVDAGKTIMIEASASKVPTATYKTNEKLAKIRADKMEQRIIRDLKSLGTTVTQKRIEKTSLVDGPEYNNDFIENRTIFEKFQYVRITVK